MKTITSASKVKEYALMVSRNERNGKFTRVSQEFLNRIEAKVKSAIWYEVKSHPSIGKTLK